MIVELFTSQGCSTCPPAEELIGKLALEPQWQGRLVPIALHVDYWNHIGWTDRFSSPEWSQRQRDYAARIKPDDVYTPQAVINGRSACIGSAEPNVRRLLAEAAARPAGRVELRLQRKGGKVEVEMKAAPPAGREGRLDAMLAVVESGLETKVDAGENAQRTLHEDFVLRHLERAFKVKGAERADRLTIRLDSSWNAERLSVALFLQDPDTREIVGAASAPVPR